MEAPKSAEPTGGRGWSLGVSPPQPIRGLGERRKLLQRLQTNLWNFICKATNVHFLASIMVSALYSLYAIARPYVRLSVYLSVTWVDQS